MLPSRTITEKRRRQSVINVIARVSRSRRGIDRRKHSYLVRTFLSGLVQQAGALPIAIADLVDLCHNVRPRPRSLRVSQRRSRHRSAPRPSPPSAGRISASSLRAREKEKSASLRVVRQRVLLASSFASSFFFLRVCYVRRVVVTFGRSLRNNWIPARELLRRPVYFYPPL